MAKKLSPVMLDTLKLLDRQNGKLDTNHSEGERRVTRAYSREMKTIQALARRELIESIDFNYYPLTPAGRAALSEPATDAGEGIPTTGDIQMDEWLKREWGKGEVPTWEEQVKALRAERDALRAALARTLNTLEGDKNLLCGATKWRTVEAVERSIKHMIADILKVLSGA